ncbi:hypothetical protein Tco_1209482 [Tanacetum coccineum]
MFFNVVESISEEERSKFECVTPSSKSSRSGDHRRSRRDLPEYDTREGRVVSRKYSDIYHALGSVSVFSICIGFICIGIDVGIGIGIRIGIGIGLELALTLVLCWEWRYCRCVWFPSYTFALQIADVFGSTWYDSVCLRVCFTVANVFGCMVTRLLYRLQICLVLLDVIVYCRCLWLPGYMSALRIADVFGFGSALICMHLPSYTSALQIVDVFGSSHICFTECRCVLVLICYGLSTLHLFGLLRIETSSSTESTLWDAMLYVCFSVFVYLMFGKLPMFTATAL